MLPERGRGYEIIRTRMPRKKCRVCDKTFAPLVPNQKDCSEPCQREMNQREMNQRNVQRSREKKLREVR